MNKIVDYIIIGSGFGGSASALRLSEKGYSVLVLEKGREFKDEDFPKTNWNIPKFLWAPFFKCFGILKLTLFRKVFILSGVGVGGGSLVFANTLMDPPKEFYQNKDWAHLENWKEILPKFYLKAKSMMGVAPNPWINTEDKILHEVAKDMGQEKSFQNVNVGVYFGDPEKPVDPYFNGEGPLRNGCIGCASCMIGCPHNAKNTLVKNYLFFAKKNKAKIKSSRIVTKIEFKDNIYFVHTKSSKSFLFINKKIYKSKGIVFSGGVLGTMDLLFKQKYKYKTLEKISDTLGNNIRTNSEMLCGVTGKEKLNNGIAISSVFNPDESTHVEIVKYPNGSNAMKFLAGPFVKEGHPIIRIFNMLFLLIKNPIMHLKLFGPKWSERSIIFLIMQSLDSKIKMKHTFFPFFRLYLDDSKSKIPSYIPSGVEVMERFSQKINGIKQSVLPEVALNIPSTAHILGGVPMGENNLDSVVNKEFKVHSYPNMYVCDGTMIPCNLGVNPSLTILALSEYAMSKIDKKADIN